MNVLILTAKFGYGHYSAAEALKERLLIENPNNNVVIIDFIDYIFPRLNKYIYGCFNFLVNKCHTIYNLLNIIAPKKSSAPLKRVVVKKIYNLINGYNVDSVISVVPICSEYISAYKKMVDMSVKLNTLITDIEVHNAWINDFTDCYLVPSLKTKNYLISQNIDEDKIVVSGIPVKDSFNGVRAEKEFKNILIMGGGLGLIPNVDSLLSYLIDNDIHLTVILGNNKKLYKKLKDKYSCVNVIGFTNKVHEYMLRSDLIITKSGGITLFEAIASRTPLYIIKPFLVQEVGNAKFIEESHIGKISWKKDKNVKKEIISMVNDIDRLEEMKENMIGLINPNFRFTDVINVESVKLC